jgi:hypothetical protein
MGLGFGGGGGMNTGTSFTLTFRIFSLLSEIVFYLFNGGFLFDFS